MNRRRFFRLSAASVGGILVAGSAYRLFRPSDPLHAFHKSTKTALAAHFEKDRVAGMLKDIQAEYASIAPCMPYIGGEKSIFTEWLDYGVYYLAVYRVLKRLRVSLEQAGEIIYRTYEIMADYPKWFLNLVGSLKYGKGYVSRLRTAAEESQNRQYPSGWVCSFVNGDGREFDYGLDITECGI